MKRILPVLLLLCFALPQLAFAGAWTLPKNNVWAEYPFKWNWSNDTYNQDCDRTRQSNGADSWGWSMSPKAEYGLFDWWTILGGLEYKEAWYKEYEREPSWGGFSMKNHGLTEVNVGSRIRFLEKPVVLSGQVKGIFYTGCEEDKSGGWPSYDDQPGITDRTNALELRGLIAKKFDTQYPFYYGFECGYRFNQRNIADQIPMFGEFGVWPINWLLIKTEVDCMFAAEPPRRKNTLEKSYAVWRIGPVLDFIQLYDALRGNSKKDSSSMENSVTRQGKSLTLEVQYGNTFWGKNTSADQEVVMKIATQF
ncbi:MAG TPA: hypothetical protein PKY78_05995 [Candidatus Omnitrophota bacterium]|nr:hypothetical protein [Candidatus Omnitrophota bacterium]HPS20519.1 hypothetical protein [Candidatus Omnitrophota bacterium]